MKKFLQTIKLLAVLSIFTFGVNWVSASYVPKPTSGVPSNNIDVPVNTGNQAQARVGGLQLGIKYINGLLDVYGNASMDSLVVAGNAAVVGTFVTNNLNLTDGALNTNSLSVYPNGLIPVCVDTTNNAMTVIAC